MRMHTLSLDQLSKAVRGVSAIRYGGRGLTFSRLPEWTYPQHAHAPIVAKMAEQLSGVYLDFDTAANRIEVQYRSLRDSNPPSNWIAGPATISITADGFESSVSHSNGDLRIYANDEIVEIIEGEDSLASFALPSSSGSRRVQIWLPQNCPIELIQIASNEPLIPVETVSAPLWVHYGSSISHCEDADGPLGVWPVAASRELGLDIYNLGLAGCANLEQFAARTIRELPANLISLKLGINVVNGATMTERTFAPAIHGFIDTIREVQPTTPILVISPICCPAHENNPGPTEAGADFMAQGQDFSRHSWIGELTLVKIRRTLETIVSQRAETDSNIFYMDGLSLFDDVEALTMPDGLHPDAAGYRAIASNFVKRVPKAWLSQSA